MSQNQEIIESKLCAFIDGELDAEGRVEIECEWTARKREREAGRLCSAIELPHSSQKRD